MRPLPEGMGEPKVLRGNEPLLLEDFGDWWIVCEGSVALFSVALRDREPWGARNHLFNVEAGQALFGLGAHLNHIDRGVLAVPLGEATLAKGDEVDLDGWRSSDPAAFEVAMQGWAKHWSDSLDLAPPDSSGDWMGVLPVFHRWILRGLVRRADTEHQAEVERVEEGARSARDSGRLAVQQLSSILVDPGDRAPPTGDDLFRAAYVVGQAIGAKIRPIPRSIRAERVPDPVEALARASQVRLRKVALRDRWWTEDCGPLLAWTREEGRPVALLPTGAGGYEQIDPSRGSRVPVDAELAADLEAEANSFYRSFPARKLSPLDLIRFALAGRMRELLLVLALGLVSGALSMAVPVATGLIVDYAIPDADRPLIWQLFLGLLAASFGMTFFSLASAIAMLRVETHANADTQAAVWDRLLRLRMNFFRDYSVGDLKSRVSAISRMRRLLSGATMRSLFASFMALLNLGLLFVYSVHLALLALVAGALTGLLTMLSTYFVLRYERTLQELEGEIFGGMVQLIQGIGKLRVAAAEERAFLYWAQLYSREQDIDIRAERVKDYLRVARLWVGAASTMALFYLADHLMRTPGSTLSPGDFLAFTAAYGIFVGGVNSLSRLVPELAKLKILEERAHPILEAEPEVDESKADPGQLRGGIALDRVTFRYTPGGAPTLDKVSLQANPGEMIALVGPSGSGKSTIMRLILGFETPESGTVKIDGQDLTGIDIAAVRQQLGVVMQNGRINAGSIFENVGGGGAVTLGQVKEAVRMAGLQEDVDSMPMGLHTVISEGGMNLSGGQRQRLLIARALVQKPSMLLFDEATSALDNRTQAIVTRSLNQLNVTRFVIAHRLSTIREADRIYVIDEGQVIQAGSFDELMAEENGLFERLMQRQMR